MAQACHIVYRALSTYCARPSPVRVAAKRAATPGASKRHLAEYALSLILSLQADDRPYVRAYNVIEECLVGLTRGVKEKQHAS